MRQSRIKIALALAFCLFGIAAVAGHFIVQHRVHREVEDLNGIIERLGPRFASVHARSSTHPMAWVFGSVANQDDSTRLFNAVRSRFDEKESRRITSQVKLDVPPTPS